MAIPSRPKLSAITLEATLNRSGLVADCIFPPVQTECKFSYIDWTEELKELKSIQDHVTCKSDANELDLGNLKIVDASTKDRALSQVLDECCVVICGDDSMSSKIEAGKTRQLTNKLLIGREERAIAMATDTTKYSDQGFDLPGAEDSDVDGGYFKITPTNFNDVNYNLLKWFQGINENAQFGKRNVMVTDQATLNAMLANQSFIGRGCFTNPTTTADQLAALLGLEKICIADARYNDGLGEQVTMKKLWPANTILFTSSHEFVTSQDQQFSFGITAFTQPIQQFTWLDPKKGKGNGALMQKIGHDLTEVVLSYKAATLVKIVAS